MNPFQTLVRALARARGPRHTQRQARRQAPLTAILLEDRLVPAGPEFRSIDGSGNNIANPSWGQAGGSFIRLAPPEYTDGISSPAGADRPGAREISNALADQGDEDVLSDRFLSAMMYAWGQFIDHDFDLTPTGTTESFNIPVPAGDPYFDPLNTGTQVITMKRSTAAAGTGTSTTNPRQQVNGITAWLDGSMVYGSDAATARSLRTMQRGMLKSSAGRLLPVDAQGNFLAGDIRVNENPELTSLQTLFVREHNRKAAEIGAANPRLTDEEIYQRARAWVIAEIQVITYKEWLPQLIGGNGVGPYRGYDPRVNPAISNEFATAAFRLGHSMLGDDIEFLGNNGLPIRDEVSLADAFFNPALVKENGIDPILKYLASDPSSEIDSMVVGSVRNFLFGPPGAGGLDLASLNIQRGRDHGLADYNDTRAAVGLPRVTSFSQITSDPEKAAKLEELYGTVDKVDLWVGVLAENHVAGGSVGPTARAIIVDQFSRLRSADRFWYQRTFSGRDLQQLESTTLTSLIQRNTNLTTVQPNSFVFQAVVSGTVFGDGNRDARRNPAEQGLANRTVRLIDATTNEVVAEKQTNARGEFRFDVHDGVRTGRYLIQVVALPGETVTTPNRVVSIQSGNQQLPPQDIGLTRRNQPPVPVPPAPNPPPPPPQGAAGRIGDPLVLMGTFAGM